MKHKRTPTILLCYSRYQFDPTKDRKHQQTWGNSANVLARTLYELLSELGKVTYIDPSEHAQIKGKSFDLFVGQIAAFDKIVKTATIKRSVLFAVNAHPAERNYILQRFRKQAGLPMAAFAEGELVPVRAYTRAIEMADHIMCVGNTTVYNSYIKHGVPRSKLKMINYAVGKIPKNAREPRPPHRVLYVASEIGLRKGFDIAAELFKSMAASNKKIYLDIVGKPANRVYEKKLDQLLKDYPKQVSYHGWLGADSKEYTALLRQNSFVLAPALEEGQAGAILDAIRQGVVPVLTSQTGIDFSPLGVLEPTLNSESNQEIMQELLKLNKTSLEKLRNKTLEYYQDNHLGFEETLRQTLHDCLAGSTWPLISVVLPIFNKEKTIVPLIKRLDIALQNYGNSELHIIFDGCKDRTEELVRKYYKITTYPVSFEVTPNIFEVKSNNLGLRKSKGKYAIILQDDNYLNEPMVFSEAIAFMEKNHKAVILGGLAGVNFYPRGTKNLKGKGQIVANENEVYWRQDADTDPKLAHRVFEVDACMRGPLILRKSFLDKHGYLDEAYVPLYQDDMDLAFRARKYKYKVYAMLMAVENRSETIASYSPARQKFWDDTIAKNTAIFYKRWKPSTVKDYAWLDRPQMAKLPNEQAVELRFQASDRLQAATSRAKHKVKQVIKKVSGK